MLPSFNLNNGRLNEKRNFNFSIKRYFFDLGRYFYFKSKIQTLSLNIVYNFLGKTILL